MCWRMTAASIGRKNGPAGDQPLRHIRADCIVAEVNQGGELVEAMIKAGRGAELSRSKRFTPRGASTFRGGANCRALRAGQGSPRRHVR